VKVNGSVSGVKGKMDERLLLRLVLLELQFACNSDYKWLISYTEDCMDLMVHPLELSRIILGREKVLFSAAFFP